LNDPLRRLPARPTILLGPVISIDMALNLRRLTESH